MEAVSEIKAPEAAPEPTSIESLGHNCMWDSEDPAFRAKAWKDCGCRKCAPEDWEE